MFLLVAVIPNIGTVVVASSPMILGELEHLRVELLLPVVGLGMELATKVSCFTFTIGRNSRNN